MEESGRKPSKSKSKEPKQERSRETKRKIIEAAKELFSEYGYSSTTNDMIAQHAGVSTGSIYLYFDNKWDIFLTILDSHTKNVQQHIEQLVERIINEGLPFDDALETTIYSIYKVHKLNGKLNIELQKWADVNEEAREVQAYWHKKNDRVVHGFLEHFKDEIRIDDLKTAAVIISVTYREVYQFIFENIDTIDADAYLSTFKQIIKGIIKDKN